MSDPRTARAALTGNPNFRWMMSGGAISMLGDQFTLIALPWLVLQMTGDALALGLVLAVMGVPRAIFILVGGALVDRYSPKRVLMLTKHANTVLLLLLAALVLSHRATMPMVYALALGLGLASAFSIPSGTSMLPNVVAPEHLQLANGMMMSVRQVTMLAGPLLAGVLIAFSGHAPSAAGIPDARGLGIAFGLDALTFTVTAWTLGKVQLHASAVRAAPQRVLQAVGSGLAMVWHDRTMRSAFLYWGMISLTVGGVVQVALPVLSHARLGGAAALGLIMGAHGAGSLLGMAASALKGGLRIGTLGTTLLAIDALVGVLFIPMGHIGAAWQGAALMLVIGALAGYMQVAVLTWLQRSVPREMLGRAMSIFMFILMGLAPLSAALIGWAMRNLSLVQLFTGAGMFLTAGAALAFAFTPMRVLADPKSATIAAAKPTAESPT